jgi:hypothetical protein
VASPQPVQRNVPPRRTSPRVPTPQGLYATQGMISPVEPPFVDPTTGTLAPVSFRFLYSLFNRIGALEQALINAGIPIPPPVGP